MSSIPFDFPWSQRLQLQRPRIPEIDCTTKIFETVSIFIILVVSLFLNIKRIIGNALKALDWWPII